MNNPCGAQQGRRESQLPHVIDTIGFQTRHYFMCYRKKTHHHQLKLCQPAWMDLESIMLSEISQSEKDKYHMMSLKCGI